MERQLHRRYESPVCWHRTTLYLTCAVIVLSAGCGAGSKSPPIPSAVSRLQYDVSYFRCSQSSENKAVDGNSLHIEGSPEITMMFLAMNQWPQTTLEPVEAQAQMITVLPASSPVMAVAGLLRRARIGVVQNESQILGQAPKRGEDVFLSRTTLQSVLPADVGASFRVWDRPQADSGAIPRLEIQVRQGPAQEQGTEGRPTTVASLEISLVATGELQEAALPETGSAASSGKGQAQSTPAASGMLATETISLKPQNLPEQRRWAVILPSPFQLDGISAFAALIEVMPAPQKGTAEAVAYETLLRKCQSSLQIAAEENSEQKGPQFAAGRRGLEDALRLLHSLTQRRQTLLYLARETGSPLIEDVALSATEVVIDRLAYAVTTECESGPAWETGTLGWRLQKTAYLLLVELMSAEQMRPELEAITMRYTGEVGRHPAVLKEMVADATSGEDLEQRLFLENFIYLEDISPAARTRAFEWLATKGRAPKGYDPLASLKERRSILNQVLQEQP